MESLGALMQERRAQIGLTLRSLARKAGLSPSHVSNLENNKQPPSEVALVRILDTLGVLASERDRWYAAAGVLPTPMLEALLEHPEAWKRVRVALRVV